MRDPTGAPNRAVRALALLLALLLGGPLTVLLLQGAARVLEVVDVLRGGGDPRSIGPVLTAGHASLRDDFEVSTPELDACVVAATGAGAHGARMVGGGFGGSVVVLVDRDRADPVADAVRERFDREGYPAPRTFDVVPAAGARRIS